jgi:hypothetical protein
MGNLRALGGGGSSYPNNFFNYDFQGSFTLAAGTNAAIVITGSQKEFPVRSATNVAPITNFDATIDTLEAICYGLVTTTSTENYIIEIQRSIDNGSNWSTHLAVSTLGAADLNKSFCVAANPTNQVGWGTTTGISVVQLTPPFTGNKILFRLLVTPSATPTTDAFTVTNFRFSMFGRLMV